jgi:membrane protease YdiL (CAAX protease family)
VHLVSYLYFRTPKGNCQTLFTVWDWAIYETFSKPKEMVNASSDLVADRFSIDIFLFTWNQSSISVIVISIVVGVIIGFTEEILWRGVYLENSHQVSSLA